MAKAARGRGVDGDGRSIHTNSVSLVPMNVLRGASRAQILVGLAGVVIGIVVLTAVRFALIKDESVHHHANFALYVNGERDDFESFTFYEEVASCNGDAADNPKTRVHMHGQVNNVVHVHDAASTWGHFFANLDYTLGNDVLKTDEGVLVDGADGNQLTFYLNGEEVDGLANRTINSEDKVLINYGDENEAKLKQRYESITANAGEYNHRPDPAACAGSRSLTFSERLKQAIGF